LNGKNSYRFGKFTPEFPLKLSPLGHLPREKAAYKLQGGSSKPVTPQTDKKDIDSAENLVALLEGQEIGFSD